MNPCPNCGVVGGNFSCPNHVVYWRTGNAPSQTWMPVSDQLSNSSLFAEIGRLNVLLNERDKEIAALKQTSADLCPECGWRFLVPGIGCQGCERARLEEEIERLKGLMPPDERGPGFVGQGSWSVFAEKVVAERDALNEILAGLRKKGIIDGLNRPLPLEGHHKDCAHGKDGMSYCSCDELKKADVERMESLVDELSEEQEAKPGCPKCGDTGRVTITDGTIATSGWCECSKQFADLVAAGQKLRKEFDQKTAGMRGPPSCSICGDTGLVTYGPGTRGMKRCDCRRREITKDTKPTRDPRQDLEKGETVRFEIEGIITQRQSAGWVKDYDGNDFEPIQYVIIEQVNGNQHFIPFDKIISHNGKE